MSATHSKLIMIRGLPGSGKSYLTTALSKALGEQNVVVLDPDATDYKSPEYLELSRALTEEGVEEKFHPHRFIRGKAFKAIDDGKIIIWNQPFSNLGGFQRTIASLQEHAAERGLDEIPMLVVEVEAPLEVAKNRVVERKANGGHGPTDNGFARFVDDYKTFADEGYNIITVQGHGEATVAVTAIRTALDKL